MKDFRAGVYMQTLLRDPAAGVMHSLIYFPFLVLLAVTTVLEINHQLPESAKFLHGDVYQAYAFVGDAAGVLFLVGVFWAIVRRYVQRPYRIRIKTKPEHAVILGRPRRHRRHRLPRRDVPHRPRGPARLRAVELRRLPARRPGRHRRHLHGWHQACGSPTWSRSSPSWRSCPSRCCATCSPGR